MALAAAARGTELGDLAPALDALRAAAVAAGDAEGGPLLDQPSAHRAGDVYARQLGFRQTEPVCRIGQERAREGPQQQQQQQQGLRR